jgi:DNA polymerase-3 subunit gamma/tau
LDYLVLARKWRPQVFEDVIGQDHVVRTLKNAITGNRIAHAYIFSGPRGVGKTTIARILAKALNCMEGAAGPVETPCNRCANCLEITEGLSMDVREIDGASNRGIDEIRELRENARFLPASSRYKIYIIDEVHMLTKEAFNALLKIIEEPPPHVLFVFATTELHKIPATILSRCQRHDFRRVSVRALAGHLRKIAEAEGIEVSDRALAWIAEAGEGSVRDSQSIFDQAISYAGKSIPDGSIEEILGLSDRQLIQKIADAILKRDCKTCLEIIDDGYYAGLDMKQFYSMVMAHFRNLLIAKIAASGETPAKVPIDLPDHEVEQLRAAAANISRETLQRLMEYMMIEEEEVRRSLNPRLNLEFVIIRMASLEPLIPIEDVLSKLEMMEKRIIPSAGYAPQSESPQSPQIPQETRSPGRPDRPDRAEGRPANGRVPSGGDNWEAFKETVKRESFPLWSKLDPGKLVSRDNGRLKISFPRGYMFLDSLGEKENRDVLLRIAGECFGVEISDLELLEDENGPSGNTAAEQNKNNYDIKREAVNHPLVQKVMGLFEGAEIREVIIKNGKTK